MSEETIAITRNHLPVQPMEQKSEQPKYPSESIELPSKGYFYSTKSPLSSGKVDLKMMTAKEEDILTNENLIKRGDVLNRLLESLIINKDIDSDDLLIGDKNALFVSARRLAYGDNYGPVKITCRNCREDSEVSIDLSEIKEKSVDLSSVQKGQNVFTITLPFSKRTIQYKLPTSKDEKAIEDEIKALTKINKAASAEVTTRLKFLIVSVDGSSDKLTIRKFVDEELLSRDSITLRAEIKKNSPDLDMSFNFTCEHCNNSERMDVPMTAQFFWPNS
jgi:hypothetical protein